MTDFDTRLRDLFQTEFPRLFRYLDRLSGEDRMALEGKPITMGEAGAAKAVAGQSTYLEKFSRNSALT